MLIWVTRPEPDASEQALALERMGHLAIVEPLLETVFEDGEPLFGGGVQAVMATSRNGLRALARRPEMARLRALPVFAVGEATATLARTLGFGNVIAGGGSGEALARTVAATCRPEDGMLLHPRGDRVAFDLKGALASKGFRVSQPVLYRMTAREALSPNITGTIRDGRLGGVILMSPRTARCYIELIESGGLGDQARRLRHFCLSAAVAEPLYPLGGMAVAVAARPCRRELLALIAPEADTGPDPTQ